MNTKKRKIVCAVLISVWVFSLCGCVKKVDEAEFAGLDSIEAETIVEELGEVEAVAGEGNASQEKPDTDMYIHVCGAVMQPGVYCMHPGERIYQAIEAAGGFAEDACDSYCNQAMELTDGMKLWIPTMEEAAELPREAESLISTVTGTNGGTVSNKKALLSSLVSGLNALNPLNVLDRGYALVTDKDRGAVSSVMALGAGDKIGLRFADGTAEATVDSTTYTDGENNG